MTDLERLLVQIAADCQEAVDALGDEHEGRTTRAVGRIFLRAFEAAQIVSDW